MPKVCKKIPHSAISFILKLDMRLQVSGQPNFFFSFVSSAKAGALQLGWASLGGLCSTEGSRGGGLGGCVVVWGVGARGWRHPPNPGHATKRLLRCPKAHQQIHRPISQFVITSRLAFDAFKENGLQRRQLRPVRQRVRQKWTSH